MLGRNTVLCWMGDIGIRPDSDRFASVPTATSLALPSRPSGIVFFTCRPPPHTPRPSLPRLPPNTRPRRSRLPKLRPGAKRAGSAKRLKGLTAVSFRSTTGGARRSPCRGNTELRVGRFGPGGRARKDTGTSLYERASRGKSGRVSRGTREGRPGHLFHVLGVELCLEARRS